jgi:hypothetical protein
MAIACPIHGARKRFKRLAPPLLILVGSTLVTVNPARAIETCHKIKAKGQGQITSQTATGAATEGRIIGGGLVHGTTTAELTFTSFDPQTALPPSRGPWSSPRSTAP